MNEYVNKAETQGIIISEFLCASASLESAYEKVAESKLYAEKELAIARRRADYERSLLQTFVQSVITRINKLEVYEDAED